MSNLAVEYIEDYYNVKNEKDLYKFNKRRKRKSQVKKQLLQLQHINPMTSNQEAVFTSYNKGNNILLHGVAGTGKTFLSLYLALDELLNDNIDRKEKVVIVRSAVPTRDIGFLPGKETEKTAIYEQPYKAICSEILNRGDAYDILKTKNIIEFITTSYIRGITLDDAIIIVDECQNMTFHELDSIITRVGINSKILLCGDFRQTDLNKPYEKSGIKQFMDITNKMYYFDNIEFGFDDIVRSAFVKEYIMAKEKYNEIQPLQSI